MSTFEVIGLGALNIDYIYQVRQVITDGEDTIENFVISPGGSAANTIYGLARLGVMTGFIGIVGNDEDGRILLQDFKTVGVDTSHIYIKAGAKTGSVLCLSDQLGKRTLYVSPGANNYLKLSQADLDYVNQAKLLHLSSFVGEEQFNLQVRVVKEKAASVKVSLSPGMLYARKGLDSLTSLLERTFILFLNSQEIELLTGKDYMAGAEECLRRGCQNVVVTFGRGLTSKSDRVITSYIFNEKRTYPIEGEREELLPTIETIGAGDAFACGFLFGLLKGKTLEECGLLGDLVAQFAISQPGARPGLPTLMQLSQRYFKHYGREL